MLVPITGVLGLGATSQAPAAHGRLARPAPLAEAADCATDPAPVPPPDGGATSQVVTVRVPRVVIVRVGAHGRVLAVTTNSGCAPGPGDTYLLRRPDGSFVEVGPRRFSGRRWHGDFSHPGVEVAQIGDIAGW